VVLKDPLSLGLASLARPKGLARVPRRDARRDAAIFLLFRFSADFAFGTPGFFAQLVGTGAKLRADVKKQRKKRRKSRKQRVFSKQN